MARDKAVFENSEGAPAAFHPLCRPQTLAGKEAEEMNLLHVLGCAVLFFVLIQIVLAIARRR